MKFGAFTYAYSTNLGDEIQTLAAMQFLPRVDVLIERDRLHWYRNGPPVFTIFNGWFGHEPSWPPPDSIYPLFVSFHAEAAELLVEKDFVSYFKRHEPIGCRSLATVEAFHRIGIEAYFSGCLTLTIERESLPRTDQVYAVDVDPDLYAKLVPDHLRESAAYLSHEFPSPDTASVTSFGWRALSLAQRGMYKWDGPRLLLSGPGERLGGLRQSMRLSEAEKLLKRYRSAKLVITSRLHCALPCLALGTPVILLRRGVESDPRFSGLRELVRHHGDPSLPIKINWEEPEPNPDSYRRYAKTLRQKCGEAVSQILKTGSLTQNATSPAEV
jgi:hypothetical protein